MMGLHSPLYGQRAVCLWAAVGIRQGIHPDPLEKPNVLLVITVVCFKCYVQQTAHPDKRLQGHVTNCQGLTDGIAESASGYFFC